MKKQLNVDAIANELSGGSAFFPSYKGNGSPIPEVKSPEPAASDRETTRTPSTPVRGERDVPPVPPPLVKRVMKQRHPFDIYRDQYEALQQLALEERKQGGVGSMSQMVREALDKLIAEKRKQKK
jgi:hypothetical protein